MKWLSFIAVLLTCAFFCGRSFAKPSRTLVLKDTEVAPIKTAIGYSTILQFDGRPSSVVLGDQDAFKVEYVGSSVTIKPLVPGSKSNMFVFTDYDRFNFKLFTGPSQDADYIVQVKRKSQSTTTYPATSEDNKLIVQNVIKWTTSHGINLKISSVAHPKTNSALIIAFSISLNSSKKPPELKIAPGEIEVSQNKQIIPIDSIYLERIDLSAGDPMSHGTLIIRTTDYRKGQPLTLSFTPTMNKRPVRLRVSVPMGTKSKGEKVDAKENKN